MSFNILDHWDGSREILGKRKTYHQTILVSDLSEREAKCSEQDRKVLKCLREVGTAGPSELSKRLSGSILKSSIRRSLNTLANRGLIVRSGRTTGEHGHPEYTYHGAATTHAY